MPVYRLTDHVSFPPVHHAESGLLAVGGDLSEERLLLAYRSGIFPWYSEGEPLLWWSPDPRMVLFPEEFHCSRSLARVIRKGVFRVTLNRAFPEVIRACGATPREGQQGTWIVPEMEAAYIRLHQHGYAHSIECWDGNELVGGLYGVGLHGAFFGESMFSHRDNASKVALYTLVSAAGAWGISLIDCQMPTQHLFRLGARQIARDHFCQLLRSSLAHRLPAEAWKTLPPRPRP